MRKSKSSLHWEKFTKSGKIEDYLNYKFARKLEEGHEANSKE